MTEIFREEWLVLAPEMAAPSAAHFPFRKIVDILAPD